MYMYVCSCMCVKITDHILRCTELVQDLVLVATALDGVVSEVLNTVHDGPDISSEVKEV